MEISLMEKQLEMLKADQTKKEFLLGHYTTQQY